MNDTPAERDAIAVSQMLDVLRNFPANGKLKITKDNFLTITELKRVGFVEDATQSDACKTCGHPKASYHYSRITPAGRYFMQAAKETQHGG